MKRLHTILFILAAIFLFQSCKKKESNEQVPFQEETIQVITASIAKISQHSARSGAVIKYKGTKEVLDKGVCWSEKVKPSLKDSVLSAGKGQLSFESTLVNLKAKTNYYVKAYVIRANDTIFGNELSFTTLEESDPVGESHIVETVLVPSGSFLMGSPEGEGYKDEHPQHSVKLDAFYIGKYEVSNAEYVLFLNKKGLASPDGKEYLKLGASQIKKEGSVFKPKAGKENYPVVSVTWYGAKAYCEWAGGRLPSEAEWEYAARGADKSMNYKFSGSNNLDEVGWYSENAINPENDMLFGKGSFARGLKKANEIGVYDMSGNVLEWCNDWHGSNYYATSPSDNPQGAAWGLTRVIRGGSWMGNSKNARVSKRSSVGFPSLGSSNIGFRVAFSAK